MICSLGKRRGNGYANTILSVIKRKSELLQLLINAFYLCVNFVSGISLTLQFIIITRCSGKSGFSKEGGPRAYDYEVFKISILGQSFIFKKVLVKKGGAGATAPL